MRFYIILFFCSVCFFFSCGHKDVGDAPDGMLNLHQMAALLTDIHIVDGTLTNGPQQPDSLEKHGLHMYLGVFKAHQVDTALFRISLHYYTNHPDALLVIYDGINHRLGIKADSLKKIKEHLEAVKRKAPNFKADSIKAKNKVDSLDKIRSKHIADSMKKVSDRAAAEAKKLMIFQKRVKKIQRQQDSVKRRPLPVPNQH